MPPDTTARLGPGSHCSAHGRGAAAGTRASHHCWEAVVLMRLALGLATLVAVVPGVSTTAAPQTATTERSADRVVTVAVDDLAPAAARRKAWKLRMVEEFNHFNSRRWTKRHLSSNSNEDSYLLASNVRVRGGK